MKVSLIVLLLLTVGVGYSQSDDKRVKQFNLKNDLAVQGYDPVSYFTGKPQQGREDIQHRYKGVTYRFISQANLEKFKADPEKYEPAYGGWCAYAMGESGEKVKIDPETFKIIDGKVYLFYNFWTNNTLTTWNKNEKQLKEAADRNWAKIIR
ncbi:MAG: YHS domain-containing protein [Cyclobacteriaceae bacterium]|nr:YHS domain-containing protein [Cyclobacteriaceae bacterium]